MFGVPYPTFVVFAPSIKKGITYPINYYLRDATGNVMAIYEDKRPINTTLQDNIAIKEIPIYGSSRLGQYRPSFKTIEGQQVQSKIAALGQRIYEFSNHLGNVLVTLTDNKVPNLENVGQYKAIVLSASDYYPFGMAMGSSNPDGTDNPNDRVFENKDYRYGFNGKENDTDLGDKQLIQDYGFRLYNPALAKFLSVDPLTKGYPMLTPYQFASNRPIDGIDLDGLEYLRAEAAKIQLIKGELFIKLSGFSDVYKKFFNKSNPNYDITDEENRDDGKIGNVTEMLPIKTVHPISAGASEKDYKPKKIAGHLKKNGQPDKRHKDRVIPTLRLTRGGKGGMAFFIILDIAATYLDYRKNSALMEDQGNLVNQIEDRVHYPFNWEFFSIPVVVIRSPLSRTLEDIDIAMNMGVIPKKYNNAEDLSTLANIVLYGGDGNEDPELRKIGTFIINNISFDPGKPIPNEEENIDSGAQNLDEAMQLFEESQDTSPVGVGG